MIAGLQCSQLCLYKTVMFWEICLGLCLYAC